MKWGYGEIDTFAGDVWELATHSFVIPIHAELRPVGQMGHDVWGRAGISMLEKDLEQYGKLHIGEAVKTPSGGLACELLLHMCVTRLARGPVIEGLEEALKQMYYICYREKIRSIALPVMFIDPGELPVLPVVKLMVTSAMKQLEQSRFPSRIVIVAPTEYVEKLVKADIETIRWGEKETS